MELAYWKLVYYVTLSGQSHIRTCHTFLELMKQELFFTSDLPLLIPNQVSEEMKLFHSMNANNVLLKGVFPFIALMLFVGC